MRFAAIPPAKSADPKMSAAMTPTNTASTVDLFWWENSTVAVTIDALKAVGVAASAIGTHELDTGQADFEGRVIPATKYPLLSATGDPPAFGTIVKTVDANVDAIVSVHRHQAHNWQLAIPVAVPPTLKPCAPKALLLTTTFKSPYLTCFGRPRNINQKQNIKLLLINLTELCINCDGRLN